MMTTNLCTEWGLFNGSMGIIADIYFANGRKPALDGCEPPRLTVPLSDPIASPIPLLDSQLTEIQPQGGRPETNNLKRSRTGRDNNLKIPQRPDGPGFTTSPDELTKLRGSGTRDGKGFPK